MDSCNSGSVQSSSGDDQEYDFHGASISTFLNSSGHFGSTISSSPLPQFLSQQPSLFDSQNFNSHFQDSTNSPYNNNDLIWPKDIIGSDHPNNNLNNFGNLITSSSSSSIAPPPHHQGPYHDSNSSIPINPTIVQPNYVGKNSKKRSRASRRAPTTVLTTDTTNFRQMVQEFTGIPTTPFTGSAYTSRFDLFSTASSAMKRSAHLDNLGPLNYTLIKPSTQKVQNSQFMITPSSSSSPFLSSSMLMPTTNNTTNASTFDQINNTIPCLDEMGMSHHEQVSANLGGFDTFGGEEQSRKDRNISRLLFDGNI